ncbi:MAG TPA: Asp-tRNA(Asn)/Glu-tRNA(Gln) amidotransferase subunit GatC [Gemmatimonadales bacterium]|jgi:aspartyl-tRNA(Asn)/glutamyl-tRNA(Gln) amidotransferase subunit C
MSIDEATVRHIAALAELAIADDDVALLATQLAGIVTFVEQLDAVPLDATEPVVVGPAATPLREDVVNPIPLARGPAAFAPAFDHGFFVVPRLGGLVQE